MTLPFVASYTSRLGFHIRAGTDKADYQDFIDMLNRLDTTSGFSLCTEATKPTPAYNGHYIKCTDTGKHYYYSGGSMASGVFTASGSWVEDNYVTTVTLNGSQGNVIVGASNGSTPYIYGATGGVSGAALIDIASTTTTDLGVAAPAFTLTATTNVLIEIEIQLAKIGSATYARDNAKSVLSSSLYNGMLQFDLYDGSSPLITEFVSFLTQAATTAIGASDGYHHLRARKVVSLGSGSHTLGIRVYNNVAFSGLSTTIAAPIFASIIGTISGA